MFGNGSRSSVDPFSGSSVDPSQPQDTKSIWGDMFGLSGLMKVITDPALVQQAHAMMQATIDGAHANRRIEAKLDRLLGALGHEINDINARFPAHFQPADRFAATALLVEHGPPATGGHAAAIGAADDGGAVAAGSPATSVLGPQHGRPDDGSADDGA
jgi:hypothetical protein